MERTRSRRAAREAIASARYARAILDLSAWLAHVDGPAGEDAELADFASHLVRKRHRKLAADLERLATMSVEERHRVRIAAKRLRYVIEGLASAMPDEKVARGYAKRLARLQDALGRANDAVTGTRLLDAIAPPESIAPRARERLQAQARGEAGDLDAIARSIAATPRFWRRKHERGEDPAAAPG
jgi:CHAD domain-containing protein